VYNKDTRTDQLWAVLQHTYTKTYCIILFGDK